MFCFPKHDLFALLMSTGGAGLGSAADRAQEAAIKKQATGKEIPSSLFANCASWLHQLLSRATLAVIPCIQSGSGTQIEENIQSMQVNEDIVDVAQFMVLSDLEMYGQLPRRGFDDR